jgi:hypothetical protein
MAKLAAYLLPAILVAAALKLWGEDLRALVVRIVRGGPRTVESDRFTFTLPDRLWQKDLPGWTETMLTELLNRGKPLGFKAPPSKLQIVVVDVPIAPAFNPKENSITLRKTDKPQDARVPLSNLLTRALLYHAGPPDAAWSPWLEEGLANFFQSDAEIVGSKKPDLIRAAAQLDELDLSSLLQGSSTRSPGFSAASHSLVAFLYTDRHEGRIEDYLNEERMPGPVPAGAFEKVFRPEAEKAWKDFVRQKH